MKCIFLQELGNVNTAFEDDSGQQDIQLKSSHSNGVPVVAATTDKTKSV
jgi:hypothetical protein